MKGIKDYLHLYLGCNIAVPIIAETEDWEDYTLFSVCPDFAKIIHPEHGISKLPIDNVKPILRPLSDMTEEEEIEYLKLQAANSSMSNIQRSAESTRWFLSKHFDVFGLIEAGLAIDKTK